MQRIPHHYVHSKAIARRNVAALGNSYRGALWGMLAGGPIGLATSLNISLQDPALVLTGIIVFWLAGGFCGHNMQQLLEGTR